MCMYQEVEIRGKLGGGGLGAGEMCEGVLALVRAYREYSGCLRVYTEASKRHHEQQNVSVGVVCVCVCVCCG